MTTPNEHRKLEPPTRARVGADAGTPRRSRYVSVLIPTKDRAASLTAALDGLTRQTHRDFEVVIVDGGSKDATREVAGKYSDVLRITFDEQSGGLISQMNKAWRLAKGEVVVRTDDDVVPSPRWLAAINEAFDLAPDVGGCTGPTVIPLDHRDHRDVFAFQRRFEDGGAFWRTVGRFYHGYLLEGRPHVPTEWFRSGAFSLGSNFEEHCGTDGPIEVSHHEACNMAVRRDLLARVDGFDPTYVAIGEYHEPDVSLKVRRLGYRIVYHPDALVHHRPSKEGFFKDRPAAYGRMLNFVNFYFRHVKPNTASKATRFAAYLIFQNAFFAYKFLRTGRANQLGAIGGTAVGLARNVFRPSSWRGGMVFRTGGN